MLKKLLAITCLFTAHAAIAQTSYPGGIPGCIARYPFSITSGAGNVLADVSGNSNSGLTHNITASPGWRGAADAAMKFDGASSYANVPDASNLSPQQITMIALVKFDGFNSGSCQVSQLICKGYPHFINGNYGMGITDNIYDNSCSGFDPAHQMRSDFLGAATPPSPQSTPVQLGKWYFMATTFEGNTWKAYQVIMDSTNLLTSIAPMFMVNNVNTVIGSNTQEILIGKHGNPSYPYWLNGVLDEEVLFNRVLSDQEIYNIYYFLFKGYALGVNDAAAKPVDVTASISNGNLHLHAPDGEKIGEAILYNLHGQTLSVKAINNTVADLDINSFSKGMLFLKIARKGSVSILKISNL